VYFFVVQYKLQLDFDARVRHLKEVLSLRAKIAQNCVRLLSAYLRSRLLMTLQEFAVLSVRNNRELEVILLRILTSVTSE